MNAPVNPRAGRDTAERLVHVVQGEQALSDEGHVVLTTILGSCVSACVRDPVAGVGGMNHFLLPGNKGRDGDSMKYGVHAMELLINGLLRRGAARARLEAKVFGGACVVRGLSSDVGAQNVDFALRFLEAERIACIGRDVGGDRARRVRYWPVSGRASLQLLAPTEWRIQDVEPRRPAAPAGAGDLELF